MNDHRIPAVTHAIELLAILARANRPLGVRDLASELAVPRSTAYRLCNSLEAGQMIAKSAEQTYFLGPAIRRLAQSAPQGFDLVKLAQPTLEAMASNLKLSVKLSVLDQASALVVLSVVAPTNYHVSTQVGRRFPLHAGAASKVLAAHMDPESMADVLSGKLERFTSRTITSKSKLRTELALVRSAGYAFDRGEFAEGVEAVGAPIFGPNGTCVAAMSVPFYIDDQDGLRDRVLHHVLDGARRISADIGAPNSPDKQGA